MDQPSNPNVLALIVERSAHILVDRILLGLAGASLTDGAPLASRTFASVDVPAPAPTSITNITNVSSQLTPADRKFDVEAPVNTAIAKRLAPSRSRAKPKKKPAKRGPRSAIAKAEPRKPSHPDAGSQLTEKSSRRKPAPRAPRPRPVNASTLGADAFDASVLATLSDGSPRQRGSVVKALGLEASKRTNNRVTDSLRRLQKKGAAKSEGQRGATVWQIVKPHQREGGGGAKDEAAE